MTTGIARDCSKSTSSSTRSTSACVVHAGLAIVMPAWMKWYIQKESSRFERFSSKIFGLDAPEKGIEALENWFVKMNVPTRLGDIGISETEFDAVAENAFDVSTRWFMHDV